MILTILEKSLVQDCVLLNSGAVLDKNGILRWKYIEACAKENERIQRIKSRRRGDRKKGLQALSMIMAMQRCY